MRLDPQPPGNWRDRVGLVAAMSPGLDGLVEVLSQARVVFAESRDGLANRTRDCRTRAFGGRTGGPTSRTEPERTRKFANQELTFRQSLIFARRIGGVACLCEVLIDLGEPPTVCCAGLSVQHVA